MRTKERLQAESHVQLCVRTVHEALDAFSSDEDAPPPVRESHGSRRSRSSGTKKSRSNLQQLDLSEISDEDLREELLKHGVHAGPIVDSTRKLYEGKLLKLLDNGAPQSQSLSEEAEVYSDREDEPQPTADHHHEEEEGEEDEQEEEEEPVKNSSSRTSSTQRLNLTVEKTTSEPPPSEELHTFTALTATCRSPIKGAAGRPVVYHITRDHSQGIVCNSAPLTAGPALSPPSSPSSQSWGKKLLLLVALVTLVFVVFQFLERDGDDEL